MSQEQPRRPYQAQDAGIRSGDVFPVGGDLADRPVAPRDAAMMQSAESMVFGHTPKGGAAAVMESAAARNEQRRAVGHSQSSDIPRDQGVTVTQTDIPGQPGYRLVTEYVAGQAVSQYVINEGAGLGGGDGGGYNWSGSPEGQGGGGNRGASGQESGAGNAAMWGDKVTIGEALEATAKTAGDKPVEPSDAAAIQAAESAATGVSTVLTNGVAAAAQAAVITNTWADGEDDETKLGDDAAARMPADKEATRQDAERVVGAEIRDSPNLEMRPGGVATTVAAAARLNEPNR
ncbi:late embryogenesis abundant protein D-34-like [Musa acuminata AAA Group]|uniref:late embryogenesis abundant protein D-34-like n=1 Tax=Musa acuminata AAA Group TaxID=214697 RepID=UPI0031D08B57